MDSSQQDERFIERLRQRNDAMRFELAITELDLALTFCQVATTTVDKPKAERNFRNAKRTYVSALRFLKATILTAEKRQEVYRKIVQLMPMLKASLKFGNGLYSLPSPAKGSS